MKPLMTFIAALVLAVTFFLLQFKTSRPNHAAPQDLLAFPELQAQEKNLPAPQFSSQDELDEEESPSSLHVEHLLSGGVQRAWVKNFASGKIQSYDAAGAMTVDDAGNVYVAGSIYGANGFSDYATIKYNAAGVRQWVKHYNGRGNGHDVVRAIAVDGAGNVLVTGYSAANNARYDYTTIKYNASGVEKWIVHFSDLSTYSMPSAIAVDQSGHIVVTGGSGTVKYDRFGNEEWKIALSGSRLLINELDQIYVFGSGVVKYNASGEKIWSRNIGGGAFAIDDSENVYVTRPAKYNSGPWTFDDLDYQTVKYNAAGMQVWSARHDGPGINDADRPAAIGVDDKGNVYVTGTSGTIRYNANGIQMWHLNQSAAFLKLNEHGALYLAGGYRGGDGEAKYFLAQYDPNTGVQQWLTHGDKNSIHWINAFYMDRAGNLYLAGGHDPGGASADFATVKCNSRGEQQWAAHYNGPQHFSADAGVALASDDEGNVYVTGTSYGSGTQTDYVTVKYDVAGTRQWMNRYNGPNSDYDDPNAIVLDQARNVYVTGWSPGIKTGTDFATIKYNREGIKQWVARYNSPQNWNDYATGLQVDHEGNVYVAGTSNVSSDQSIVSLVKYNAAGKQQWVRTYGTVDYAEALAVDDSGYVYVTGSAPSFDTDILTVKYDGTGRKMWAVKYNGVESSGFGSTIDHPQDLAVDNAGNVYVAGNRDRDYLILKYNAAGKLQWTASYNGLALSDSYDFLSDLTLDQSGNVYVTGQSNGYQTTKGYVYVTIKYSAAGAQQWRAVYKTGLNNFGGASKLALDRAGNVYATGFSSCSPNGSSDVVTIKYNVSGAQEWMACYKGELGSSPYVPETVPAYANAIAVDNAGHVYVTGGRGNEYVLGDKTMLTIKYAQTMRSASRTSAEQETAERPAHYRLGQNYPNPFNPSTTIRYAIAKPGHVTLQVFNLHGQEIATLVNENKSAGEYDIQWTPDNLSSGAYLYRLQAGEFIQTRKLVLLQ